MPPASAIGKSHIRHPNGRALSTAEKSFLFSQGAGQERGRLPVFQGSCVWVQLVSFSDKHGFTKK